MSTKEIMINCIVKELDLIPENYLVNLLTIIHAFKANLPDKQKSKEKVVTELFGSWKGNETVDELVDFIYSNRNDKFREVVF